MQAKANRGILYVDEVNLLDDGLVDVVLDSSASGVNTVEREGVGIVHPAKFIMIGSGNPQARLLNAPSCRYSSLQVLMPDPLHLVLASLAVLCSGMSVFC